MMDAELKLENLKRLKTKWDKGVLKNGGGERGKKGWQGVCCKWWENPV